MKAWHPFFVCFSQIRPQRKHQGPRRGGSQACQGEALRWLCSFLLSRIDRDDSFLNGIIQLLGRSISLDAPALRPMKLCYLAQRRIDQPSQDEHGYFRVLRIRNQFQQEIESGLWHVEIQKHTINRSIFTNGKSRLSV